MSGLTTAVIQYCVNPYVIRLARTGTRVEFTTLSLFGRQITTKVPLQDLERSQGRAFSTWRVRNGADIEQTKEKGGWFKPRRFFYVHGVEPDELLELDSKQQSFDELIK